jgi:uncharacterized phage protein gp47/JayE
MNLTLDELAASDEPCALGAAALIEASFAGSVRIAELEAGSVTRTLAETLARELAKVYEQLGEAYDSAFIDTATGDSLEVLVNRLCPRRSWWWPFRRP